MALLKIEKKLLIVCHGAMGRNLLCSKVRCTEGDSVNNQSRCNLLQGTVGCKCRNLGGSWFLHTLKTILGTLSSRNLYKTEYLHYFSSNPESQILFVIQRS